MEATRLFPPAPQRAHMSSPCGVTSILSLMMLAGSSRRARNSSARTELASARRALKEGLGSRFFRHLRQPLSTEGSSNLLSTEHLASLQSRRYQQSHPSPPRLTCHLSFSKRFQPAQLLVNRASATRTIGGSPSPHAPVPPFFTSQLWIRKSVKRVFTPYDLRLQSGEN